MSKSKGSKKSDKDSKSDKPKQKREIEFNLSDGFSWHDVAGIFKLILLFFWRIIRLILAPIFWIIGENMRMWRFIRASGDDRPMNEDEQKFVETLPFIYTLTGVIGGIIVGVFFAFSVSDNLDQFFQNIRLDFFGEIFRVIAEIIVAIYNAIKWLFSGIFNVFSTIGNFAKGWFERDPFLAFLGLATIGIVVLLMWVAIHEQGVLQKLFGLLGRTFVWLVGSPDRFRFRVDNFYRRMNHKLTALLVGEGVLITRTQLYFRRVALYTSLGSIYSFLAGVFVGYEYSSRFSQEYEIILFISVVLFVAGFLSGTLFFALIARFLDLLSRSKYIAPEYKNKEGDIDQDAIESKKKADKAERDKAYKEYQAELAKMSEKPWKKRDESKSKKATTKKSTKKAESEDKEDSSEEES